MKHGSVQENETRLGARKNRGNDGLYIHPNRSCSNKIGMILSAQWLMELELSIPAGCGHRKASSGQIGVDGARFIRVE